MAIFSSFAVKLGVGLASTLALVTGVYYGTPKLLQGLLNKFFNEIELEILKNKNKDKEWTVDSVASEAGTSSNKISVKTSTEVTKEDDSSVTYKWECVITATGDAVKGEGDKSQKLVSGLKKWLNQDGDKQENRTRLVLACSMDKEEIKDNSVKTRLDLSKYPKLLDLEE